MRNRILNRSDPKFVWYVSSWPDCAKRKRRVARIADCPIDQKKRSLPLRSPENEHNPLPNRKSAKSEMEKNQIPEYFRLKPQPQPARVRACILLGEEVQLHLPRRLEERGGVEPVLPRARRTVPDGLK